MIKSNLPKKKILIVGAFPKNLSNKKIYGGQLTACKKLKESIYLLANGIGANLKSICFLTAEKMDEDKFEIINPLFKKAFGGENYKLTDNPIDAIKYQNIIFIFILGKTKKKDINQLKKKLEYQKSLKIGYLALRDGF